MTGSEQARLAVSGALMLALVTFGDAGREPAATAPSKERVRLVVEANFGDAVAREYERLLPGIRVERVNAVGSMATVAAIQRGDADLGFAFADVAYLGYLRVARQPSSQAIQV